MSDHEDLDSRRRRMMDRWHEYGKAFTVFVPEEQPFPETWEPELRHLDEKGRLDPQALKHWHYLFPTKEFLRQRYARSHILEGPTLRFDCLAPKFQRRMHYRVAEDQYGDPLHLEVKESHDWYDSAMRIGIFGWQVGFSCSSVLCQRSWCKLHRDNPQRINPADVYSLVQIFEGVSLGIALSAVAKWFKVKLRPFASTGRGKRGVLRYAVPKQAVYVLLSRYSGMRHQHVEGFVKEAVGMIQSSPSVPWHGRLFDADRAFLSTKIVGNLYRIKSPAAKAYLWLLIQQEESARNTREVFGVTDSDLAKALGVSLTTASKYRRDLDGLRLLETDQKKRGKNKEITIRKAKY